MWISRKQYYFYFETETLINTEFTEKIHVQFKLLYKFVQKWRQIFLHFLKSCEIL